MIVRKDVSPLVLRFELIVGLDMDTPINTKRPHRVFACGFAKKS
jgi:hypothetical protein